MIFKYEVLNPVTDKNKPYLDKNGYLVIPNPIKCYYYCLECRRFNEHGNYYEYFILFGTTKFDANCRACRVDDYGKLKYKPQGEMLKFIEKELAYKGNLNIEYIESENGYDVFLIH